MGQAAKPVNRATAAAGQAGAEETTTANLLDVVRTLFRWKKPILLTSLAAGVLAAVISLLLPVYYQSQTAFLPISPDQQSPENLFGGGGKSQYYGNANDIDRLMNLAESNELVDHLVDSFNLYEHYDIDPTEARAGLSVAREFLGLYEVTKTSRDAIVISVEDKDPRLAAQLARAAREEVDRLAVDMMRAGRSRTIMALRGDVTEKENELTRLSDSLSAVRERYSIYDIGTQAETLAEQQGSAARSRANLEAQIAAYRNSSLRGARDSIAKIEVQLSGIEGEAGIVTSQLAQLNAGMSRLQTLAEQRGDVSSQLSRDFDRLKQYEAIVGSEASSVVVIEEARVPVLKSRPHRSLIVVGAILAAFILCVLGILFIENSREVNWREIYRGR